MTTNNSITWGGRLKYLCIPFGLAAFGGWFLSLMLWPVYAGIASLAVLFGGMSYLALFVWPHKDFGDEGSRG